MVSNPQFDETKQIHRVAGFSFLLNLLLAVMKTILAIFSGSLAITASAIDSGTDAIASLAIYAGIKLSTKKTRSFPLGLYKLENVASVVIALFIFIAGYEIIREIFSQSDHLPNISLSYILLLSAATVAIFLFGQYALFIGLRTESPALIAEGRHRQVDVLSSIVVLISVCLNFFDIHFSIHGIGIDHIGAALILIFIIRSGWDLLSDGMRVLLDASIDVNTLSTIREIILSEPMVSEISSLIGRSAGRFRFIQTTITLKTENLETAHRISEEIQQNIQDHVKNIEKVVINYGPEIRTHIHIALPLHDKTGRISQHFGEAPLFAFYHLRTDDHAIETMEMFENPHQFMDTAKGIRVAEWLVKMEVNHVGIKEDVSKKGPGYVLSNSGIKLHVISAKTADEALTEIIGKTTHPSQKHI